MLTSFKNGVIIKKKRKGLTPMKHTTQKQLKKFNDTLAIASIIGLVKKGKIKEAIQVAENRKFTPEQFGKIAKMTDYKVEDIYNSLF